ncbi:protein kinase [Micromonospora sp. NPDC050397]|uniref:serine/threonine-protein kinase n=1 Tax=Micromonospora sp. NPDC050397 TaxID=3364279 RepID=UPI00384EFD54
MTDNPPGALPKPVVPGLTDLHVFARGGYATVYRATQGSVGREVAVKVENRTLGSERDQRRFLREARAAGRMSSHPHVVDLFDAGVTEDQHPYLIMELCDGSYAERMRTSPLGPAEARDLGMKIADALAHSHAMGVLHRDVKPANILHSHFNPAVLADFGLAVLAEVRDTQVTLEVLTPAYAPPEMFRHSPPSPAVDVYALSATLYAVMQGKPPRWRADRNPSLVTLMELFSEPIPDLPGVPPELVEVLRFGMANDPDARPTAAQLRDLLAALPLGPVAPISGAPVSGAPTSGTPFPGSPVSGGPPFTGSPAPVIPTSGVPISGPPGAYPSPPEYPTAPGHPSWPGHPTYPGQPPVPGPPVPGPPVPGQPTYPGQPSVPGQPPVPGQSSVPGQRAAGRHDPDPAAPGPPTAGSAWPGGHSAPHGPAQPRPPVTARYDDDHPTVRTNPRRRRLRWFFGGLGVLVLMGGTATGSWYAARADRTASPEISASATGAPLPPDGSSSGVASAGGALPGCRLVLPRGVRCTDELECFGPMRIEGTQAGASRVPCAGRHTWEAYATGDLPATVDAADHQAIWKDLAVQGVCNDNTFRVTTQLRTTGGWQFQILPPTGDELAPGERTFRCLAGKGTNVLDGPTLAR